MIYKCTRSDNTATTKEALLSGTSPAGGLYVPNEFPLLDFEKYKGHSYGRLAVEILSHFFNDLGDLSFIEDVYVNRIKNIPIKIFDNLSFIELYHGPTFAFKDFALSLLPEFLNRAKPKCIETIRVITATSGDTGSATLSAFENVQDTEAIVFYPKDMVSPVQEAQMQIDSSNLFTASILGNFDKCQMGVKKVFADEDLRERLRERAILLSSANSINIGRLLPQTVYYVYAYLRLCDKGFIKYGDLIDIAVPTGNFGNILAGYYAKKMSLPIGDLICASNENDVLTNFFHKGEYIKKENLINTISPSMDILISSNLERLLYHETNSKEVSNMMNDLKDKGSFKFQSKIEGIKAEMATQLETLKTIKKVYEDFNYLIDPHTGVAMTAINKIGLKRPALIISTAHPYKFPRAMIKALSNENSESIEILESLTNTKAPTELKEKLQNKKTMKQYYNIDEISIISERTIYANKN